MSLEDLEELAALPTQGCSIKCEVNLGDLMEMYDAKAAEAGVKPLLEENDVFAFFSERKKWDPGLGSSWKPVRDREPEDASLQLGSSRGDVSEQGGRGMAFKEPGTGRDVEADAPTQTKRKRKRPRGPGSKVSRRRHGKDLKHAGSDEASRKMRLTDKWFRRGESIRTDTYSLAHDGSHSASGWQGVPPPTSKRKEVTKAYDDGSIVQILGSFFPVPYHP
jgi:hypothetical protein